MTYESLGDGGFITGTMLGSGGFIVMDETTSIVKIFGTLRAFIITKVVGSVRLAEKAQGGWKKF